MQKDRSVSIHFKAKTHQCEQNLPKFLFPSDLIAYRLAVVTYGADVVPNLAHVSITHELLDPHDDPVAGLAVVAHCNVCRVYGMSIFSFKKSIFLKTESLKPN
jgi:hypothetical protein